MSQLLLSFLHKNAHSNTLADKLSYTCSLSTQECKIYSNAQNRKKYCWLILDIQL